MLTVIDNTVDTNTGTIHLKATFDNADHLLWPGQFVNVVLTLDTQSNATVVPSEAVQDGQQGQFIFVVKPDQTVRIPAGHGGPHDRPQSGHRQGRRAGRDRGNRRPVAPVSRARRYNAVPAGKVELI